MILYTPLSATDIFPVEQANRSELINCNGRQMLARNLENGSYEIEQLLSTDPHDFMHADYMPGNVLKG
ncbi:YlzJ-like family protein [Aciduricibacillus chroicocephali]|uniref:YlzJ-like family protein n=1 Tax=Aciduricibacillus chroicocephali TaxID=3054939 RepID=A0ABY9KYC9_9BACI|nr:YlzJ-like family protein [Bacillaceae bacterium 44XB]